MEEEQSIKAPQESLDEQKDTIYGDPELQTIETPLDIITTKETNNELTEVNGEEFQNIQEQPLENDECASALEQPVSNFSNSNLNKVKKKLLRPWKTIVISVIVFCLLILCIPLYSQWDTNNKISSMVQHHDVNGLLQMLEDTKTNRSVKQHIMDNVINAQDSKTLEQFLVESFKNTALIDLNLQEQDAVALLKLKQNETQVFIESLYFDETKSTTDNNEFKKNISQTFLDLKLKFNHVDALFTYWNKLSNSDSLYQPSIKLMQTNQLDFSKAFTNQLQSYSKDNNFSDARVLLNKVKDANIGDGTKETALINAIGDLDNLSTQINDLNTKVSSDQSDISSLKSELDKNQSIIDNFISINLEAYIVGKLGNDTDYEIALPRYDSYGRWPSSDHALLITTSSTFTSTGWTTIEVHQIADQKVNMKDGFVQTFKAYQEVSDSDKANYNDAMPKVGELNTNINAKNADITSLNDNIASVNSRIASKTNELQQSLNGFSI